MKDALYLKKYKTFLDIKNHKKQVELRLDRGFISKLTRGDIIAIKHSYYILIVEIIDIRDFSLFPNVLKDIPLHLIFPDIKDPNEAKTLFYSYYNPELISNSTIKAIHLKPVTKLNSSWCLDHSL